MTKTISMLRAIATIFCKDGEMLPATSRKDFPWYIIPADHKWVRNYWMSHILTATLEEMNPKPPEIEDKSLVTKKFK